MWHRKAGIISKAHRIIKGQNILVLENKDLVMLYIAFVNAKTWFTDNETTINVMRDE